MNNNWKLIAIVALLAAVYMACFTNWFKPEVVHIFHTYRNLHPRLQRDGMIPMLIFGMNQPLKLTEIKVVSLSEYQTNHAALPLWHLVSVSNSVPVKTFFYGQSIRGLKPEVSGRRPQPLSNDIIYRLIVVAGKTKGEHDFKLK